MSYVPEPELTWHDIQKAIETASLPVVPAPAAARVPLGPGSRVRVKSTAKNEGEFDNVEDYVGAFGTIHHRHDEDAEYEWCVTLDGHKYSTEFHTHELEEAA